MISRSDERSKERYPDGLEQPLPHLRVVPSPSADRLEMPDLWLAVRWLHVVAMAFFVGGQLFLAIVVVPVERAAADRDRLRAIARRFGYGTLVAISVLLVTGTAMATHLHLWSDGTLQLKLVLVALVGILLGWHIRRPDMHALEAAVFVISLIIAWLGLALSQG
jgi:putative copper export protein